MANLIYDVNDKPKFSKLLLFALQQVLAVLAATIAVPTIIGLPTQIPAAILGAGLGTIVYLLFTKFKSPVIISSSFAFLSSLATGLAFGYMGIVLGAIFAGLVYVVIAIIVHFVGTRWINKLMPAVIIGPTVAIIGLSLAGNAVGDLVKASGSGMSYNLIGLLCGLATFFTVVICSVQNKFKNAKLLPFIIGIGVGYALASIFSIFGYAFNNDYLKIVDWSALKNNFTNIKFTSFLDYPRIGIVEGIKELADGKVSIATLNAFISNNGWSNAFAAYLEQGGLEATYEVTNTFVNEMCTATNTAAPTLLNWTGVATCALAFIPVAFVVFAEHIADHANLGTIIDKHLLNEEPGLSRTLLGDGVGSMVGTVFGVCPNTTYGESVGCVAITRNASVRTIITAAIMLIILAFVTPITALLKTIPSCVMGGVCLTLYGFIAVSGLKMFKEVDLNKNKNLFTVAAILITGIGGLVVNIPIGVENNQVTKVLTLTSIASALILGIVTHAICEAIEKRSPEKNDGAGEVAEAIGHADRRFVSTGVKGKKENEAPVEERIQEMRAKEGKAEEVKAEEVKAPTKKAAPKAKAPSKKKEVK